MRGGYIDQEAVRRERNRADDAEDQLQKARRIHDGQARQIAALQAQYRELLQATESRIKELKAERAVLMKVADGARGYLEWATQEAKVLPPSLVSRLAAEANLYEAINQMAQGLKEFYALVGGPPADVTTERIPIMTQPFELVDTKPNDTRPIAEKVATGDVLYQDHCVDCQTLGLVVIELQPDDPSKPLAVKCPKCGRGETYGVDAEKKNRA